MINISAIVANTPKIAKVANSRLVLIANILITTSKKNKATGIFQNNAIHAKVNISIT